MYKYPGQRFYVANRAQKVLFLHELRGQLSDGNWENARPADHWEVWCGLEDHQVVITNDPSDVGRNFTPRRDRYDLTSKDLLDVVGSRMIRLVRLSEHFDFDVADELNSLWSIFNDDRWFGLKLSDRPSKYELDRWNRLSKYDMDEVKRIGETNTYDLEDLKRDLRGLKVAMRTYKE